MARLKRITAAAVILLDIALVNGVDADQTLDSINKGVKYYRHYNYGKALACFEEALIKGPKHEKSNMARYAVSIIKGSDKFLQSIQREEGLLRLGKGDGALPKSLSEKHHAFARKLVTGKFYLQIVESHLTRALELEPDNAGIRTLLANAYYFAMEYAKSRGEFEKNIAADPRDLYSMKMAGDASIAIGDFDNAKKNYTLLIKANDVSALKFQHGEIEKVRQIIKALPETYKDIDELFESEKLDEAELMLKKRISLNSADYIALTALGQIYQDRGDGKNALNLYEAASRIAPDYPIAHLFLGRAYFLMRRYDEALYELKKFKEKMALLPNMDSRTKKMYINSLYYLAEIYYTLKQYNDFKAQAEDVLRLDPKEQDAYYNLAIYFYVAERKRSEAYKYFKKVIELDPGSEIAKRSEYAIEFMRKNPDPRMAPDFSFIDEK